MRVFLVSLLWLVAASVAQAQPPNIIVILTDDQSPETISAYGTNIYTAVADTPNIDAIAAAGVRFSNSFVQSPLCQPSRTTLLTGKSAENHGVIRNARLWQPQANIAEMLQGAGYRTAAFGKSLHSPMGGVADPVNPLVPVGFDHYNVNDGADYIDPVTNLNGEAGHANPGYAADLWTQQAIDWIAAQQAATPSAPFFVYIGHPGPHYPLVPRADHAGLFAGDIAKPASYTDDLLGRSPLAAAATSSLAFWYPAYGSWTSCAAVAHGVVQPPLEIDPGPCNSDDLADAEQKTEWFYQQHVHDYLRVVRGIDVNVGELRAYLATSGLAANTVVIFAADNGFLLGEHFLSGKYLSYEQSIRVPLMMEGPGLPAGVVDASLVSNLDWAPTILDLAGVEIPAAMEGRSLLERLDGTPPEDWRQAVYIRNHAGNGNRWYGIRTSRYKLIHHDRVHEWELIDLQEDPLELTNVYGDEQYADVVAALETEMASLGVPSRHRCPGDANLDGGVSTLDGSIVRRCLNKVATGICAAADFDGNGVINSLDWILTGKSIGTTCAR
ncbi:MAG TPA: sulfatase-like hydrolase/transferase [Myxococcota bacterium]